MSLHKIVDRPSKYIINLVYTKLRKTGEASLMDVLACFVHHFKSSYLSVWIVPSSLYLSSVNFTLRLLSMPPDKEASW